MSSCIIEDTVASVYKNKDNNNNTKKIVTGKIEKHINTRVVCL